MNSGPHGSPDPFDSHALVTLGQALLADCPFVDVRIPVEMADRARSAWERQTDRRWEIVVGESEPRRAERLRAWAFALVGLAVMETGRQRGEFLEVRLPASAFSRAICAAVDEYAAEDM